MQDWIETVKAIEPLTKEELERRRKAIGLSQTALGELIDTPQATISRWETGEIAIQHPKVLALAMHCIVLVKATTGEPELAEAAVAAV